ncbi:MAG: hypothetical protein QOK79_10125, partial [Nitrososphaeraceae archaeon]|nr:hypothetical protein [Nitrososphaeraceae archaeon]
LLATKVLDEVSKNKNRNRGFKSDQPMSILSLYLSPRSIKLIPIKRTYVSPIVSPTTRSSKPITVVKFFVCK